MPLASLFARPSCARAVVFVCALVAYSTSLSGPFQFDDLGVIVRYAPVHSLGAFWHSAHGIRPLLKLSYALSSSLGGGAVGFHLFNLAVHLVDVELAMRLCTAASDRERRWPFAGIDARAFVTGLLFAVHPVQTEAVTYISGRSSSLMTAFVLVALLLYAGGARAATRWPFFAGSLLALVCAVLTKEVAASLPAGLLLWDVLIERPRLRTLLLRQGAFAALLLALGVSAVMSPSYFTLLYQVLGTRPLIESLSYQLVGAAYLLSRLVLVHRLSIDPGLGFVPHGPGLVLLSAGAMIAVTAILVTQARARPVVAFGAGWFLLQAFLPYVVFPRIDVTNERHLYVANAGVFMAVASLAVEWQRRYAPLFGAVVLSALIAFTALRNLDYRSELSLWESTARVSPENPRAHNNLGTVYEAEGRLSEARAEYVRALTLEPRYAAARKNLTRVEQDI